MKRLTRATWLVTALSVFLYSAAAFAIDPPADEEVVTPAAEAAAAKAEPKKEAVTKQDGKEGPPLVTVKNPESGSPEAVIQAFIAAGVDSDFSAFWDGLCHPDYCVDSPKAKAQMQKYSWKRMLKFAASYFEDAATQTFVVHHTVPKEIKPEDTKIKFFIMSSMRDNPTPVEVKKDGKGNWKIYNSSL